MKNTTTLIAASLAAFATSAHAVVVLDAFTDPGAALTIQNTTAGPVTVFTATPGASIFGGSREVTLTKKSGASAVPSDDITLDIGGGFLGINAANPVTYSFTSLWDGTGEGTLPGVNDFGLGLNAFGATTFSFSSALDQLTSASLKVRLYTTSTDYAEYETGLINSLLFDFDIPVASFVQHGTGVNLANITAIELFGDTTVPGTDWNIGDISINVRDTPPPVPEVSTAVSAGAFAIVGACYILRRRHV